MIFSVVVHGAGYFLIALSQAPEACYIEVTALVVGAIYRILSVLNTHQCMANWPPCAFTKHDAQIKKKDMLATSFVLLFCL
jgi:hypothetical protein